jgi:hypothetical protein
MYAYFSLTGLQSCPDFWDSVASPRPVYFSKPCFSLGRLPNYISPQVRSSHGAHVAGTVFCQIVFAFVWYDRVKHGCSVSGPSLVTPLVVGWDSPLFTWL